MNVYEGELIFDITEDHDYLKKFPILIKEGVVYIFQNLQNV